MKTVFWVALALLLGAAALAQQPAPQPLPGGGLPGGRQGGAIRGPCREDALKYCRDVQQGEGRIIACLEGNMDRLAPACKAQIQQILASRQASQKPKGPGPGAKQAPLAPTKP